LVLDTSAPVAVVAVVDVDAAAVIAEVALGETRRHAESLPAAVDEALASARVLVSDLDGIGVGVGPGSFIGVRTGIAFAKGLGRAVDRPVVGLPSLLALALSEPTLPRGRGLTVVDAKRGERYVVAVTHDEHGVAVDAAPTAVGDGGITFDGCAFVVGGVAGLALPSSLVTLERHGPSGLGLVRALRRSSRVDERAALTPSYVRPPDAKLPAVDPARHRPTGTSSEGT
jgi:tRNA threonylcarbamoyladenosine biosynthesis protein TsaB